MLSSAGSTDPPVESELPLRVQLAGAPEANQAHQGPAREGGTAQGEGEGAQPLAAAQPVIQFGLHGVHLSQIIG